MLLKKHNILIEVNMINSADVVVGLAWGDEGKGKITSSIASKNKYDYVCRWAGGSNAGHTVYIDGNKYETHIIPSGIFRGIPSIIGPGCVVNKEKLYKELEYLSLIHISEPTRPY